MDTAKLPAVVVQAERVYQPGLHPGGVVVSFGGQVAFVGSREQMEAAGIREALKSDVFAVEVLEAENCVVTPGLIDGHVHLIGGGGEGGPQTRTPEVNLTQLTKAGITTVVGLLGVDTITRCVESLLAKARALETEGITTYIYTGGYELPTRTITGSVRSDLVLIDKIVGVGEIAIADHRSAQPETRELARVAAEARVGGLIGDKPGLVHLHLGRGGEGLARVMEIVDTTDLPPAQFYPTHVNRSEELFSAALEFHRRGGSIDLTAGVSPDLGEEGAVEPSVALARVLQAEGSLKGITLTSDGNGSLPSFDAQGNLTGMIVGPVDLLVKELRQAVLQKGLPMEEIISAVTENSARVLNIYPRKGTVQPGCDADFVVLTADLEVRHVVAKGRVLVKDGRPLVAGTFERT